MQTEPLLTESLDRFSLHPVKYPKTYDLYKKQIASFWTVDEVDLGPDINDWKTLTENEKKFILHVLSFFNASDLIVNENLAERFSVEVQIPEAKVFYGFQIGMETIHTDMYGLLIVTYEKDTVKRDKLTSALKYNGSIKKKADWAMKWISDKESSFAKRMIAFACVEGIFFCASFCAIFYFKKRGKLPGLTFSNELISRDESMHRDFAVHLYNDILVNKLDENVVKDIVSSAVEAENEYVREGLDADLIGLNSDLMQQYVKCVADHLLVSLNCSKLYNVENPFEWMDIIGMEGKTNFFEKRVAEYAKAGHFNDEKGREFNLDAEF